ncbi:G-type lectin S-receptor-like serine/threonine-protein kinase CES101 [Camellia sinensis]|uniref:G-type lectin S-receptor-like serine/threonine-protein kinase CES101 n=1 Tax=Camellia sinensis TaxID=4442 RepID=UPI001036A89C|nr:G-type lectin S-receptor-like serine/threonine-protein kinase CES101 [Camellia sinensis]
MHWFGDIVDPKGNDINGKDLYVLIHDSDQVRNCKLTHKSRSVIAIAAAAISIGLLLICSFGYVSRTRMRSRGILHAFALFSLRSILAATDNFSEANKLGEGGYGPVYKGYFPEVQEVAIEKQSKTSLQGTKEFMNELKLIAKLQHKNLVRLLGCCVEQEEKILIHNIGFPLDPSKQANLDWTKRFQITEGIAQGLIYLRKYSRLKVIHRDLKASNILLDEAMNPKISDFGTARSFGINQIEANTRPAWENWKQGSYLELIDPLIKDTGNFKGALKSIAVRLLCVQEFPGDRPTISLSTTKGLSLVFLPQQRLEETTDFTTPQAEGPSAS